MNYTKVMALNSTIREEEYTWYRPILVGKYKLLAKVIDYNIQALKHRDRFVLAFEKGLASESSAVQNQVIGEAESLTLKNLNSDTVETIQVQHSQACYPATVDAMKRAYRALECRDFTTFELVLLDPEFDTFACQVLEHTIYAIDRTHSKYIQ